MIASRGPTEPDDRSLAGPAGDAPAARPAPDAPARADAPLDELPPYVGDERSLDALLRQGINSSAAFGTFYESTVDEIIQFFRRRVFDQELSADLTAETFAQLLRNLRKFDPHRGSARQYLYGIAKNHYLLWQRKGVVSHRHRHAVGMVELPSWDVAEDATIERLDAARLRRRLAGALSALTTPEREAIERRIVDGSAYRDIAAELGCTEVAARVRVSRGLAKLATLLERERPA